MVRSIGASTKCNRERIASTSYIPCIRRFQRSKGSYFRFVLRLKGKSVLVCILAALQGVLDSQRDLCLLSHIRDDL